VPSSNLHLFPPVPETSFISVPEPTNSSKEPDFDKDKACKRPSEASKSPAPIGIEFSARLLEVG